MANRLTKKEKGFVKEYIKTGNGTQSALAVYDTDDYMTAAVIAHENLNKPKLQNALLEALDDDLLADTHRALLQQIRLDYFVFPKSMDDQEIIEHVFSQGLTCINIRPTDKGKMAFFSVPDAAARSKALELAYKIKGSFAPEKSLNVNVEVEASTTIKELTEKLNALHRGAGIPSDGGPASAVGTEAQS